MKTKLLAFALSLAALLPMTAARAQESEVSFEVFYDNLSPLGEWIEVGDYGTCWRPKGVDADWAPYTDGYWSYTDAGWTWISYEDFGDICYHYGRWVDVDDTGWCWVPDYEWGPAWVSWRESEEHIGWAPLPPEARWSANVGFSTWVDDSYDIGPSYYNFCPIVDFGAPVIRYACVPRVQVFGIFGRCRNITNICYNSYSNVVFCGGPNIVVINQRLRRPVPTFKLVQNTTIINNNVTIINNRRVVNFQKAAVRGNTLNVFAPKIVNKTVNNNFKPQITKVVNKDKVNRGWRTAGVNQQEVTQLRQKVKSEAKGQNPENAPARPVKAADLKPLPEKADPTAPSPVADRQNKRDRGQQMIDRPGGRGDGEKATNKVAGEQPNKGNRPDRPNAPQGDDKPNKIAGDRPGKGDDAPNRVGIDGNDRPNSDAADRPGKGNNDKPDRPNAGGGNVQKNPFNDGRGPGNQGRGPDRDPALNVKPNGGNGNAGNGKERERGEGGRDSEDALRKNVERQQQMREQGEGQRQNAENAQRQRQQAEAQAQRQQQAQAQAERQARQAQAQQQMQRQAENQQRQMQQQRNERQQVQRQQQPQIQQRPQGGGGQGQGQGKGRESTPEEREKKKQKN